MNVDREHLKRLREEELADLVLCLRRRLLFTSVFLAIVSAPLICQSIAFLCRG